MSVLSPLRTNPVKSDPARQAAPGAEPFFDCTFLGSPRELVGPEPYAIFRDDSSDGFGETLIRACRGEAAFRGIMRNAADLPKDGLVFVDGPTWDRNLEALQMAGVKGERARVLLYFDRDASSFWDFAIACGADLPKIFQEGVDSQTLATLAPFLELYVGGRVFNGRIAPLSKFYVRDFLPAQIQNGAAIARVMAAMADDQSRADYARILFGTNEQVFQAFTRTVFGTQQYMDIVKLRPGDVVMNCGVSRGWEIPFFLSRLQGRGHVYNIDPNIQFDSNPFTGFFKRFKHMMTDHRIIAGQVNGKVRFGVKDANMIMSDMSQSSGDYQGEFVEFDSRSIDSLMRDGVADRLDYLKMDVEGSELGILEGAVDTIRKYRPKLAVAIYHEPHHFWDYPSFILDHFKDYRFYLRQYGYSRFETLLYAVPEESLVDRSGEEGIRRVNSISKTSSAAGAAKEAGSLLYHARDAAGQPRQIYSGNKLSMVRVFGSYWATAEITPTPWIDADDVTAIIEDGESRRVIAYHREGEQAQVILGTSSAPTEVEWVASQGASAAGGCVAVESDFPEQQIITYEAGHHACAVFAFDFNRRTERTVRRLREFVLPAKPVAASWIGQDLAVVCLGADGAAMRAVVDASDAITVTPLELPKGEFAGMITYRTYDADGAKDEPVWAFLNSARTRLSAYRETSGEYEMVAETDFDPRTNLVTTYVKSNRS